MSDESEQYFLARLRDRIIVQDMEPLFDGEPVYKEYLAENKLRHLNHLEDLVLEEGPDGLFRSIEILKAFATGDAHNNY